MSADWQHRLSGDHTVCGGAFRLELPTGFCRLLPPLPPRARRAGVPAAAVLLLAAATAFATAAGWLVPCRPESVRIAWRVVASSAASSAAPTFKPGGSLRCYCDWLLHPGRGQLNKHARSDSEAATCSSSSVSSLCSLTAVGETVILLHPPPPSSGVSMGIKRGVSSKLRQWAQGVSPAVRPFLESRHPPPPSLGVATGMKEGASAKTHRRRVGRSSWAASAADRPGSRRAWRR